MFIHTDKDAAEDIAAEITKDQAVALVCCYHGKPYHGESRLHRTVVCEILRTRGLLHPTTWATTPLGHAVAAKLA